MGITSFLLEKNTVFQEFPIFMLWEMAFKFEKLIIWSKALEIADEIHTMTRTFPKEELFILTSQIKRAADSISLNIAEGSTGQSTSEQLRFIRYAQRSALEVVNGLFLTRSRKYIDKIYFEEKYLKMQKIIIMIQAFRRALIKKESLY